MPWAENSVWPFYAHLSSVKQNKSKEGLPMEQIPDDQIGRQIEESGWPWWMQ